MYYLVATRCLVLSLLAASPLSRQVSISGPCHFSSRATSPSFAQFQRLCSLGRQEASVKPRGEFFVLKHICKNHIHYFVILGNLA